MGGEGLMKKTLSLTLILALCILSMFDKNTLGLLGFTGWFLAETR
jgi:uncharacterized membrane protein YhdT